MYMRYVDLLNTFNFNFYRRQKFGKHFSSSNDKGQNSSKYTPPNSKYYTFSMCTFTLLQQAQNINLTLKQESKKTGF